MAESTVWRDVSGRLAHRRGPPPLVLAYAKGDRSRIDEITPELHPGPWRVS